MKTIKFFITLIITFACSVNTAKAQFCTLKTEIKVATYPDCVNGTAGQVQATSTGNNGLVSYNWSNGTTTYFQTIDTSLIGYKIYLYASDTLGCYATDSLLIGNFDVGLTANFPTCNVCTDGTVFSNPVSTGPFTYVWSNSATTQNINNVGQGTYYVTVTDGNGCKGFDFMHLYLDTLDAVVYGSVFYDTDTDAIYNIPNGDRPFPRKLLIQPGNYYCYPNNLGNYFFEAGFGSSYTVGIDYDTACLHFTTPNPVYNLTITLPTTTDINFGLHSDSCYIFHQSGIYVSSSRCGQPAEIINVSRLFSYFNNMNVELKITVPLLTINGYLPSPPQTISGDTNIFNFQLGDSAYMHDTKILVTMPGPGVKYAVHMEIKLSDTLGNLKYFDSLTIYRTVTCPYDPNEILVYPTGDSVQHLTPPGTELEYTINFQNTGTDTAYRVIILDTLDSGFDFNTFELLHTSHNCNTVLDSNGQITFTFNQIMLPDSNIDEPNSHGSIIYKIKPKANLTIPYQVNNTAYIYFDQNEAVQTNTAYNLYSFGSIGLPETAQTDFTFYPNPGDGIFYFNKNMKDVIVTIYDVFGRELNNQVVFENKIDLSNHSAGIYQVQINSKTKREVYRLLKK
ncbi:MAG: T9SS type A sorting domain-containing protein [Bacteroidetes bacterium]|nr:T9SS type A sorting domain-containing protein [Bacteroidota bacterium]